MIKEVTWNIRDMRSKGSFDRLMRLVNLYNVNFIALPEPFLILNHIEEFRTL